MLSHKPFYFKSIRKIVAAFGTLFNDIQVERTDTIGNVIQTIKVPISYGPKEKWFYRDIQDENAGDLDSQKKIQVVWPKMSYEILGMNYDPTRKLPSTGMNLLTVTDRVLRQQFQPVPWNIEFVLHIGSRNIDDGLAIIEQILPFFTPSFSVTISEMEPLELLRDIPFVYNNISQDIQYKGDFTTVRHCTWSLTFTAKANLYQPVIKSKLIIDSTVNIIAESDDPTRSGKAIINTVPNPIDANPDDNWTYNTTIVDPA